MRTQSEILADINNIRETHMSVCIFGMGKIGTGVGRELLKLIDINVDYYCDSNPNKWGVEVEPKVFCISPDELATKNNCACFVLLGQYYGESGVKQVKELGIEKVIDFDELCSLDIIIDAFMNKIYVDADSLTLRRKDDFSQTSEEILEYQILNPKMKKIAVYTCIAGNYDDVVEPEIVSDKCDYYLISDIQPANLRVYQWIDINKIVPRWVTDNARRNRYCKINGVKMFSAYQYSIYIDGNVKILKDICSYIDRLGKIGLASHAHAYNNCLYVEAVKVVAAKVDDEKTVREQVQEYKREGMPRNFGQFQNAVLVRENNNPIVQKIMCDWWREVFTKSYRDQLSLTYCLWKNGFKASDVGMLGPNMRKNTDFVWVSRHHV